MIDNIVIMDESMDSRIDSMSHIEDLNKQLEQNFMEFIQNKEDDIDEKQRVKREKNKVNHNIREMEIVHKREMDRMVIEVEQIKESAIEIVSQKE